MAIATVVTIAKILKNNRLVVKKIDMRDETREHTVQKAKIEILLGKIEKFDELMAAPAEERELAEAEDHI